MTLAAGIHAPGLCEPMARNRTETIFPGAKPDSSIEESRLAKAVEGDDEVWLAWSRLQ